jgi:hypothetical protein
VQGRGNGQLPAGYLPIRNSGATRSLYTSAREVGAAVRAQKEPKEPGTKTPRVPGSGGSSETAGAAAAAQAVDAAAAPVAAAAVKSQAVGSEAAPQVAHTTLVSSGMGSWLLPVLLGLGLTGLLVNGLSRWVIWTRRSK